MSLSVNWKLFLVKSDTMEIVREIKQARDRSFQFALAKPGGCNFTVPLDYDLFADVENVKYGVLAYRNKVPKYSGMIWNLQESTDNNKLQVQTVGWFETLNHRLLREAVAYPPFGAGTITAGEIVFADPSGTPGTADYFPGGLLTIANAQQDTWISEGSNTDVMQRIIAYPQWQNIGQAITQLSEMEAGFTWEIHPETRVMDIKNWDDYEDKTDTVHFAYKWGPNNIKGFSRTFDASTMVNRYTALGKFGGGLAEDKESQEEFQLFEEQTQLSEVVDPNVMLGFAGGEVVIRSRPRVIYSFQPFPYTPDTGRLQPFEDFDIGDKAMLTAIRQPRIDIRSQAVRIFGMDIQVTNEGNEKLTSLSVSP